MSAPNNTPVSPVTELMTERLRLVRAERCRDELIADFFVRNVDHLDPWLPEARPIAESPAMVGALRAVGETELRAGREERWFVFPIDRSDLIIGYVFLTRFRRDGHRSCELSFGLDAQNVGRGQMREAVGRALQHAEETLGFSRVDARYATDNEASGRLLSHLGFEEIGVAPAHAWVGGVWRDHVLRTRVRRPKEGAP